jgi:hypothetical protein
MFWKTWNFLQGFWNGHREDFLVIEHWNGSYEVTRASRNFKKKEITILERYTAKNLGSVKHPVRKTDKIIFSLRSDEATTAETVVTLKRHDADETINEGEMDQLVYQGFWDFLNRYRAMAAKKMGVSDSDLIMAYIQVREVYIGSNKVFNPIGFKGKELSLRLRGTFVPRGLLDSLNRFKNWGSVFVFEGAGVPGPVIKEAGSLIVQVGEDMTTVFRVAEDEQVFEAVCDWGTGLLDKTVVDDLGVDEDSARSILELYFQDEVSAHVKRWLDSRVNKSLNDLSNLLESVKKRSKMGRPKLYFTFRSPGLASSPKAGKLGGFPVRIDEELERREFVLRKKNAASAFDPRINQNTLALLYFKYDLPKFGTLNQLLHRRVRWLIPNF